MATEEKKLEGRAGFIQADKILQAWLQKVPCTEPKTAASWAAGQLKLQAVQHLRSLNGNGQEIFMRTVCGAINALELIAHPSQEPTPTVNVPQEPGSATA